MSPAIPVRKRPAAADADEARPPSARALKRPAGAKPDATPPSSARRHDKNGITDYGKILFDALSKSDREALLKSLESFGTLRMASACTGSNIGTYVAQEITRIAGEGTISELYYCESVKAKRRFCEHVMPEGNDAHAFLDIGELYKGTACCDRHGTRANPKQCGVGAMTQGPFLFTCGFSCKNLSRSFVPEPGSQQVDTNHRRNSRCGFEPVHTWNVVPGTSGATCQLTKFFDALRSSIEVGSGYGARRVSLI
jgi:hypothetical protein